MPMGTRSRSCALQLGLIFLSAAAQGTSSITFTTIQVPSLGDGPLQCLSVKDEQVWIQDCDGSPLGKWVLRSGSMSPAAFPHLCLSATQAAGVKLELCKTDLKSEAAHTFGTVTTAHQGSRITRISKQGDHECVTWSGGAPDVALCADSEKTIWFSVPQQECTMKLLGVGGCLDSSGGQAGGVFEMTRRPANLNLLQTCLLTQRCSAIETDTKTAYAEGTFKITKTGNQETGECYAKHCTAQLGVVDKAHQNATSADKNDLSKAPQEPGIPEGKPCTQIGAVTSLGLGSERKDWTCCLTSLGGTNAWIANGQIPNRVLCMPEAVQDLAIENAVSLWDVASGKSRSFVREVHASEPPQRQIRPTPPEPHKCGVDCKRIGTAPWCCCPSSKCKYLPLLNDETPQ